MFGVQASLPIMASQVFLPPILLDCSGENSRVFFAVPVPVT